MIDRPPSCVPPLAASSKTYVSETGQACHIFLFSFFQRRRNANQRNDTDNGAVRRRREPMRDHDKQTAFRRRLMAFGLTWVMLSGAGIIWVVVQGESPALQVSFLLGGLLVVGAALATKYRARRAGQ